MKNSCEVVKDLLPLYYDNVCSGESRLIVEQHLEECEDCRQLLAKMGDRTYEQQLQVEKEDVVARYKQSMRRKIGLVTLGVFALALIACFIVNLAVGHRLDWFFIVLTAIMVGGSLTAVPLLINRHRGAWTLCGFVASLLLLLLTCAIYTQGNWFFVTTVPILFGLTLVFLPIVLAKLPLPGRLSQHKGLLAMAADTVLLYAVILVSGLHVGGGAEYWSIALPTTTVNVLFAWVMFAIIRYLPTNKLIRAGVSCIVGGVYLSLVNDIINRIIDGYWYGNMANANLLLWNTDTLINANSYLLTLLAGIIVGAVLLLISLGRSRKGRNS